MNVLLQSRVSTNMNFPQKTREEIKAEREAKKAAKAAAKAAKGKNVSKVTGSNSNVKNVSPVTNCNIPEGRDNDNKVETNVKSKPIAVNCNIPEKSTKPDATSTVKDSRLTREASMEETIQSSNIVAQYCTSESISNEKVEGKSKAELRAERRAKQEAQRAAKQQLLVKDNSKAKELIEPCVETKSEGAVKKDVTKSAIKEDPHQLNLFKHLYHERENSRINVLSLNSNIHPAIVRLGVQYESKVIVGSNARCVALLAAVKQVVQDFEKPTQADFIRGLEKILKQSLAYLHHCRPLAVSQQNAIRHLKLQMTRFSSLSDEKAKNKLQGIIDTYILEQIQLAGKAISITIREKISNGNVILTYGYSSLIHKILVEAYDAGKQFRVIVVDGRPWLEGKEQLRRLVKHGIECSYILINALSFVMPEVQKTYTLSELQPGITYDIRIRAHNDAGSSVAEYKITTLQPHISTTMSAIEIDHYIPQHNYSDLKLIVPLVLSSFAVIAAAGAVFYCFRKRPFMGDIGSLHDAQTAAALDNKQNMEQREQYYATVRKPLRSPIHEMATLEKIPEYSEDIYPYATFQLEESVPAGGDSRCNSAAPLQTFVYHDPRLSTADTLQLRESDCNRYTKVRGGRSSSAPLHKAHKVSQGKSESEEYDTLGSDSDTEVGTSSRTESSNHLVDSHHSASAADSRVHNFLYHGPESSTSTEPSPIFERKSFPGRGRPKMLQLARHTSEEARANFGSIAGSGHPKHQSSNSYVNREQERDGSGNLFVPKLDPPSGFSDAFELSEAECDFDRGHNSQRNVRDFVIAV